MTSEIEDNPNRRGCKTSSRRRSTKNNKRLQTEKCVSVLCHFAPPTCFVAVGHGVEADVVELGTGIFVKQGAKLRNQEVNRSNTEPCDVIRGEKLI